jgi:hypothetical protein
MGWVVDFGSGEQEIGGYDLKILAEKGKINRKTKVYSTTKQKWCEAGEIAGLVFHSDNEFDFGVQPEFEAPPVIEPPVRSLDWMNTQKTVVTNKPPKRHKPSRNVGLFDFGFHRMLTPVLCGWAWGGCLVFFTFGSIAFVFSRWRSIGGDASSIERQTEQINIAILAFSGWVVSLVAARITLECIAVLFKCAAYLRELSERD